MHLTVLNVALIRKNAVDHQIFVQSLGVSFS